MTIQFVMYIQSFEPDHSFICHIWFIIDKEQIKKIMDFNCKINLWRLYNCKLRLYLESYCIGKEWF